MVLSGGATMCEIKDKIIYVAAPYGGDEANKEKVECLIRELVQIYPDYCFVSPIHTFGFLYREMDYDEGIAHCLTLLDLCTEIWIFGDSKGTRIEREYAKKYKIPIVERGD